MCGLSQAPGSTLKGSVAARVLEHITVTDVFITILLHTRSLQYSYIHVHYNTVTYMFITIQLCICSLQYH